MAFKWLKRKKGSKDAPSAETDMDAPPSETVDDETHGQETLPIEDPLDADGEPQPEDYLQAAPGEKASPEDPEKPDKTAPARGGFMSRLRRGLTKTRDFLNTDIEDLFSGKRQIDDDLLEELEELLITADIGVQTTMDLMDAISRKASKIASPEDLKAILKG